MTKHLYALAACLVSAMPACTQSPTARAAAVAQTACRVTPRGSPVASLDRVVVLQARPLYAHVMTGNNSEERVIGARLLVAPPAGLSLEDFTRALRCHGAKAVLGQSDSVELRADPFWMPGDWVDIDVKSEDGNFAVSLRSDNPYDALQELRTATAFAESHGQ